MGHPKIHNRTPFVLETLFVADENGVPLCVPIVKATFAIASDGSLTLAEKPLAIETAGTMNREATEASYAYEPETAFFKPATDVVLIGHAHATTRGQTEALTGISVGPVQKLVRVVGDRIMVRRAGVVRASAAQPFERIPLVYERAFGGWDRRHPEPHRHSVEPRNPVGTGYRDPSIDGDDDMRLPNLEDPQQPFGNYGDRPAPAGFGFVSPHWEPRRRFAGTYDEKWDRSRRPLLPRDFDRRFFNAASPGLVAPGYLNGDEPVVVLNASPEGRLAFDLPRVAPPVCRYELRARPASAVETRLDTVIVNTDSRQLILLWRAQITLRNGPHDLVVLQASCTAGSAAA
jgi:hypothetical protein